MSHKNMMVLVLISLLTTLNVGAVVISSSVASKAAVRGMHYRDLVDDPDFTRAVKSIVERCKMNLDLAKLKC